MDDGPVPDPGPGPAEDELTVRFGRVGEAGFVELEDGDELPAHLGCQGGAHIDVAVRVEGEESAQVDISVAAMPVGATTPARQQRFDGITALSDDLGASAELNNRLVLFEMATSRPEGEWIVSARVTAGRRSGSVERQLTLVAGETCAPGCDYDELPGTATIDSIEPAPTTDGSERVYAFFSFEAEDGTVDPTPQPLPYGDGGPMPAACVAERGIVVGATFPAEKAIITRGGCSPVTYQLFDADGMFLSRACSPY